jgi:hypothetical protein
MVTNSKENNFAANVLSSFTARFVTVDVTSVWHSAAPHLVRTSAVQCSTAKVNIFV